MTDATKRVADIEALTAYYRSLGFFQAKVGREVQVVNGGNRDWTMLTFVINEGPRYNVRNISFMGNSRFKDEFLSRDLKLKSGEPFNQSKMDADLSHDPAQLPDLLAEAMRPGVDMDIMDFASVAHDALLRGAKDAGESGKLQGSDGKTRVVLGVNADGGALEIKGNREKRHVYLGVNQIGQGGP